MTTIRHKTPRRVRGAGAFLFLCILLCFGSLPTSTVVRQGHGSRPNSLSRRSPVTHAISVPVWVRDLTFAHLTTEDGLSQNNVIDILQDRRGFMWVATGDGLNRYDGNAFVVYKNNPNDPGSLSDNFIRDVIEDDRGDLWVAAYPGLNKFDPATERSTRYVHDPKNPNSIIGDSVESIARDSRGFLWLGTSEDGLDRFDPVTNTFAHYRNDSDGQFVGRITHVIEDSRRDIWFVGARGLFHLDPRSGRISRPRASLPGLAADYLCEDNVGNLWMLAFSPIVGLVKYERQQERFTTYPLGAGASGLPSSKLLTDAANGFWVASSLGLYYFDRRSEQFTRLFKHDESNPHSLTDNAVVAIYRDRANLLWVGTQKGGINTLDFQQEQFTYYTHRTAEPGSLAPGTAIAIHQESDDVLWVGFFPRALDRLDRTTGTVTHYVPGRGGKNSLSNGGDLNSIYKDSRGYLWLGGWASGLDRFEARTAQFKHYGHDAGDPGSLMSDDVLSIYEDRSGNLWVGQFGGVSLFDRATERFTNYRPDPTNVATLAYSVSTIHQDRSGTIWFGTLGGVLIRVDDRTKTFVNYPPDLHDAHKLHGGSIGAIHEDRSGMLWLASGTGLYRYNRQDDTFTRYTESEGLPTNDIMGVLEDGTGMLWVSTKKGISRFDRKTGVFRSYDGVPSDQFSRSCYEQDAHGEMFFCGSNGITAFFPEHVRDNPYVPPIVITDFKLRNKPVPVGAQSILKNAIPYLESLTLSYWDNVFSFEFAALSYAHSRKNRYRFQLEAFDSGWNEVDSKLRVATYTNLNPGRYVFRVQGSNSDGVWNESGVSLPILITPPWWMTTTFRAVCVGLGLALLWAAHRFRIRQVQHEFAVTFDARVRERTRIARELHDTLLQSFHGLLLRLQTASYLLTERPSEAKQTLDSVIDHAAKAITEGRDAVQGLRASSVERNDLALAIRTLGDELASDAEQPPALHVAVEGQPRDLHPIVRDEIYRIAAEALRNAHRHAHAGRVEVEIRYDDEHFRLRVRDDGKGIDPTVLASQGVEGHYGLRGMPERALLIGGTVAVWSDIGGGTEVELRLPGNRVYATPPRRAWRSPLWSRKTGANAREGES